MGLAALVTKLVEKKADPTAIGELFNALTFKGDGRRSSAGRDDARKLSKEEFQALLLELYAPNSKMAKRILDYDKGYTFIEDDVIVVIWVCRIPDPDEDYADEVILFFRVMDKGNRRITQVIYRRSSGQWKYLNK
jgi:hypothetical protein